MSIALLANITCTMQTPTSTIPPPDESIWGEEFSKRVLRAPNFADSFRTANAINYRRSSSLDYKDVVSVLVVHDNRKPVWCGPPCTWENGIAHRVMGGELSLAQADVRNARKKQLKCVFDLPLGTFGKGGAESPSFVSVVEATVEAKPAVASPPTPPPCVSADVVPSGPESDIDSALEDAKVPQQPTFEHLETQSETSVWEEQEQEQEQGWEERYGWGGMQKGGKGKSRKAGARASCRYLRCHGVLSQQSAATAA